MIRWIKLKFEYIYKHTRKGEFGLLFDELKEIFTDPYDFAMELTYTIARFCKWGYRMRNIMPWDAHCLYKIVYLKLDDCRHYFNHSGHLMWNSNDDNKEMRRMRECSELAKRLYKDDYHVRAFKEMIKKYGKNSTPLYDRKYGFYWENIKTQKEKDVADKYYKRLSKKYEKQYNVDKDRFHHLLKDGISGWWD